MREPFWEHMDTLIRSSELVIDRPKGTSHPRYPEIVYPLDYGYLEGTSGGDGNEIDVWRGSLAEGRLDAVICTVDMTKRDSEVKLLIGCSAAETRTIREFHNRGSMSGILVERER